MSQPPSEGLAIKAHGLQKSYPGFSLSDVSFEVPRGRIVGFIGENGAGKTTTINLLLNLLRPDSGEIRLLDMDWNSQEQEIKARVAAVPDECPFPPHLLPGNLGRILGPIYPGWDEIRYQQLLKDFHLPADKMISALSRGMRAKLALAVAVSQSPELLVLDEATTGLDVGARDDIKTLLLDFIQDQRRAVFFSTHLTEDLARIADHILLIHQGRIIFQEDKDTLLDSWGIVKTRHGENLQLDPSQVVARKNDRGFQEILVRNRGLFSHQHPNLAVEAPSLDDILLFYIKGEVS